MVYRVCVWCRGGVCLGVSARGCLLGWGRKGLDSPEMVTAAGGRHPTGMHTCLFKRSH